MFKSLKEHPKPVRYIAYITYVIAFVCALASLITNNTSFLLLGALPVAMTGFGEIFYQVWVVEIEKQKNTKANIIYLLFFSFSFFFFPYPPLLKKVWKNIGKRCWEN